MWELKGTLAILDLGPVMGSLPLDQPEAGIAVQFAFVDRKQHSTDPLVSLWKIALPSGLARPPIQDAWIRGRDLITTYGPTTMHPSRSQVYWRILPTTGAIGLELMVSVQTEALDDDPTTAITSEFSRAALLDGECWWLPESRDPESSNRGANDSNRATRMVLASTGPPLDHRRPGTSLVRLSGSMSYLEMVHPHDFGLVQLIGHDGHLRLRSRLFENHLEKGVIRRCRMRCWFLPTTGDLSAAARLAREFVDSEPPLTT